MRAPPVVRLLNPSASLQPVSCQANSPGVFGSVDHRAATKVRCADILWPPVKGQGSTEIPPNRAR